MNSRDTGEQRRLKVEGKKWGDSRSASAEASSRVLVLTVEVGAGQFLPCTAAGRGRE